MFPARADLVPLTNDGTASTCPRSSMVELLFRTQGDPVRFRTWALSSRFRTWALSLPMQLQGGAPALYPGGFGSIPNVGSLQRASLHRSSRRRDRQKTKMKKRVAKTRARTKIERASCEARRNVLAKPTREPVGWRKHHRRRRDRAANNPLANRRQTHLPIAGIDTRLPRLACDCAHVRAPSSL